jgi:hypothetical protein
MLSHEPHPDLIINMDESGFPARPLKGAQKSCVFSRDSQAKPRFLEKQDANHVTLVGAVTISGNVLVPLLLSTRVNLPSEIASAYITNEFSDFRTPKGYRTGPAMDDWVSAILLPYGEGARMRLQRYVRAVLIIDRLRSQSTPFTRDVFQRSQVRTIELVSHTAHLHQPLDLCLFGVAKHEHGICGTKPTELQEKLSGKIERILKARHRA